MYKQTSQDTIMRQNTAPQENGKNKRSKQEKYTSLTPIFETPSHQRMSFDSVSKDYQKNQRTLNNLLKPKHSSLDFSQELDISQNIDPRKLQTKPD